MRQKIREGLSCPGMTEQIYTLMRSLARMYS